MNSLLGTAPAPPARRAFTRLLALALAGLFLVAPAAGCSNEAFIALAPPMLPARYFTCMETTPSELYNVYLAPNARRVWAEAQFNGEVFVFKNVRITKEMLEQGGRDSIWIIQVICYAVSPDQLSRVKPGQLYDIVGVSRGVSPEWRYSVYLTECYVMPAGTLALPTGDSPVFVAGY